MIWLPTTVQQYLLSVVFWDDMITYHSWWQYLLSVVFWDDMITYHSTTWQYLLSDDTLPTQYNMTIFVVCGVLRWYDYLFTVQLMTIFVVCGVLRWYDYLFTVQLMTIFVVCGVLRWYDYLFTVQLMTIFVVCGVLRWYDYLLTVQLMTIFVVCGVLRWYDYLFTVQLMTIFVVCGVLRWYDYLFTVQLMTIFVVCGVLRWYDYLNIDQSWQYLLSVVFWDDNHNICCLSSQSNDNICCLWCFEMIQLPIHSTTDDNICCLWCFEMIWLPIHSTTWQYLLSVVFWDDMITYTDNKYCHQLYCWDDNHYLSHSTTSIVLWDNISSVVCGVLRWYDYLPQYNMTIFVVCGVLWDEVIIPISKHHRQQYCHQLYCE